MSCCGGGGDLSRQIWNYFKHHIPNINSTVAIQNGPMLITFVNVSLYARHIIRFLELARIENIRVVLIYKV